MGRFVNPDNSAFRVALNSEIYVDKTGLIDDINKILNAKIPEGDYDTLSGYLQEKLGRIPEEDEKPVIDTETVTYKIELYEDKRILKVKACKNNIEEKEEEEK